MAAVNYFNRDPVVHTWTYKLDKAAALASKLFSSSVNDAYKGLKSIIRRKWGARSPLATALEALEASPNSKRKAIVLERNVAATDATSDAEVKEALDNLVHQLKKEGIGGKAAITISGGTVKGVAGAGSVLIEEVTLGKKTPQASAPSGFYFALEGKGTRGNEVLWGTAFNLVFNYARPPEHVLARLKGEKLAEVVEANAELGIDVVPKGLTLIDSVAHRHGEIQGRKDHWRPAPFPIAGSAKGG
jgi:hypothetical protein